MIMHDDLVSIIVPVYNAENTLDRCIQSILKSTYKNIELILIDDCSKDKSYEIIRNYSNNYSFIHVFKNDVNRGVSHTRNIGLKNAIGKYIIFIDSDDWVEEKHIETLVKGINGFNDQVMVVTGYVNDDRKFNHFLSNVGFSKGTGIYDVNEIIADLYNQVLLQQLWNKIFIKDYILKNHIEFDESMHIGEDTRFVLQYLKLTRVKKIYIINQFHLHYMRDQNDSLMQKSGTQNINELIINLELLYNLTSLSEEKKKELISKKKNELVETNAYLIYHNASMSKNKKKELIYSLDKSKGKELYKKNKMIYCKEKITYIFSKKK